MDAAVDDRCGRPTGNRSSGRAGTSSKDRCARLSDPAHRPATAFSCARLVWAGPIDTCAYRPSPAQRWRRSVAHQDGAMLAVERGSAGSQPLRDDSSENQTIPGVPASSNLN